MFSMWLCLCNQLLNHRNTTVATDYMMGKTQRLDNTATQLLASLASDWSSCIESFTNHTQASSPRSNKKKLGKNRQGSD
eukprot:1912504-Amphidinium_carterae.1